MNSVIESFFDPNGDIASLLPDYRLRPQQLAMALAIEQAISHARPLMVEAGTGTGKTLAYLIPAIASGARVIISTGTKTLQDQLFYKDLPLVRKLVRGPLKTSLLKGRANYLCPYRLEANIRTMNNRSSAETTSQLLEIRKWSSSTRTGDLTEILDIESQGRILPLITSNVDNCLGSECPNYDECPVYAARARAAQADLVVVNHHLLFADLSLQDENVAAILPSADVVIVDEAHQVADVARQFYGQRISSGQLTELCRDIEGETRLLGTDDVQLLQRTQFLERRISELHEAFHRTTMASFGDQLALPPVRSAIENVDLVLADLAQTLESVGGRSKVLSACHVRARRFADRFALLTEANEDEDFVHWIDVLDRGFVIHLAPLSIAGQFGAHVRESGQSWVFTSATLTIGESFDHMKRTLGLDPVQTERFESPFDFERQVRGYIPRLSSRPGTDEHTEELIEATLPVLRQVPGRTFFLVTSYRALGLIAARLAQEADIAFVVQGQQSKQVLLAQFGHIERCVLLATHSFWEGVDVRGTGLRCLIIDKLPFSAPDDPLVRAQVNAIERRGGNGFLNYMVPEAAITLRQGFGRLVREESDRGLFVLGDTRVRTQPYGQIFVASLPALKWCEGLPDATNFLGTLSP